MWQKQRHQKHYILPKQLILHPDKRADQLSVEDNGVRGDDSSAKRGSPMIHEFPQHDCKLTAGSNCALELVSDSPSLTLLRLVVSVRLITERQPFSVVIV